MSEVATPTNSTAQVTETSENVNNETTNERDPDRWDDEPEVEETEGEEPKPEKKAEVKKKPTKEETEKEEKKAAEQRERRLRKMMIDGKEELIDEEEAIRSYAKNRAADKRLQEAAEARKQLDAFREQFEKDPLAVLSSKNLPINKRELAQKWLKESIAEELKDPLQAKLEEKEAKIREYEEKELTAKQEAEAREQEQKSMARREELAKVFGEAMQNSVLSKDPAHAAEVLREMAMYARIAKQADPDAPLPTPEELATHVENQRLRQYHSVAQTLSGEQLIQFMGEAVVNKIRKADLERIKKQRGMSEEPETVETDSWAKDDVKKTKERKFVDPVSMREITRKRLGL